MVFYGVNAIFDERFAKENICIPSHFDENGCLVVYISGTSDCKIISSEIGKNDIFDYKFEIKDANYVSRLVNTYYSIELADRNIYKKIREFLVNEKYDKLFEFILENAISLCASDIHIFKESKYLFIRFRINSIIKTFCILDSQLLDIISRIVKVRSNVDISKTTKPIDSKFIFYTNKEIDIRVSIVNAVYGDKISLRILSDENIPKRISELGLDDFEKAKIFNAIFKESGIILITGPTGSGKTTLVKCFLNELNDAKKHIVSLEHPIEYAIDGVTQIYIDENKTSFEDGMKSILRQDPDIIFIGEVRDKLSAETAMRASITGHLVFTTLHTQTEKLAIERLENLGIDKTLMKNSVIMIFNQRLVSKMCKNCKREIVYLGEDIKELNLKHKDKILESLGCERCSYSGVESRILLLSIADINMILEESYSNDNIKKLAIKKFLDGTISIDEVRKFL